MMPQPSLSLRRIARIWWPLAASWLLMTSELPLISAVIARLQHQEVNLAAWGIVFSIATLVQAPSTMLLAASTALSKDWDSYRQVRRFMLAIVALLTTVHVLIAFTPLYYLVIRDLLGAPAEIIEPARLGLMIMAPWSAGTAYRRFQQGVLIRFDQAQAVIWGSLLRLSTDSLTLAIGYLWGQLPGVVVAASAIIIGVVCEAFYTGWRVRPIHAAPLKQAAPVTPRLTVGAFSRFYIPLAVTVLLTMLVQPLVSAALSRMPRPLESLAVWPVVWGLLILWQSSGIAYNEAVIALLDESYAVRGLRRFTALLMSLITLLLLVMIVTPLATLWLGQVAALTPPLVALAQQGLWLGLLLPGLRVLQSWYQGAITYSRHTRGVTESVVAFLLACGGVLGAGVAWGQIPGLFVGLTAVTAGLLLQTGWLWWRSRQVMQAVQARDASRGPLQSGAPAH
jgi:hypothetical protein